MDIFWGQAVLDGIDFDPFVTLSLTSCDPRQGHGVSLFVARNWSLFTSNRGGEHFYHKN